jgi:stearoyl-CoA desaturase (delta-9 desaturase)
MVTLNKVTLCINIGALYHYCHLMLVILIFFLCHWYVAIFSQTFLQHRYASHAAFSMSKFWERFFYLLAYIGQGSSYISPRVYAIMHRMHHAYTDTDKDPHSPKYDKNVFAMMWRTRKFTSDQFDGKLVGEERFLKNLPDWKGLDRLAHFWTSRILWIVFYVLFYVFFAPSAWWYLLIPVHVLMLPLHGAVINWFAHKYGTINFKMKNTSRNLYPMDIFLLGEAYHNNHHKTPSSTNFGKRWYEMDPVYPVILFFNWLHIIRINKQPALQRILAE